MSYRARQNQFEVDLGRQQFGKARRTKLQFVRWLEKIEALSDRGRESFFPAPDTQFVLLCICTSIPSEGKPEQDVELIPPGIFAGLVALPIPVRIAKFRGHAEVTGLQLNATTCDKPKVHIVQAPRRARTRLRPTRYLNHISRGRSLYTVEGYTAPSQRLPSVTRE